MAKWYFGGASSSAGVLAPSTPATWHGGWDDTGTTVAARLFAPAKIGLNTSASRAETSASTPLRVAILRAISQKLATQTITGTVDICLSLQESNSAADFFTKLYIAVMEGDTDVVRGVLLDYEESSGGGATEWPTTAAGRALQAAQALTDVDAIAGDRLLVEVGYRSENNVTTSRTGTTRIGGRGTDYVALADLTVGSTDIGERAGFLEFSNAITLHADEPTNLSPETAIELDPLPYDSGVFEVVSSTYELWWKRTVTGDENGWISVFAGVDDPAGDYTPVGRVHNVDGATFPVDTSADYDAAFHAYQIPLAGKTAVYLAVRSSDLTNPPGRALRLSAVANTDLVGNIDDAYLITSEEATPGSTAVIDAETGEILTLLPTVASEDGVAADNGRFVLTDKDITSATHAKPVIYNRDGSVRAIVDGATVSWTAGGQRLAAVATDGVTFYSAQWQTSAAAIVVANFDEDGTILRTWSLPVPSGWSFTKNSPHLSIAVSRDGATLYYHATELNRAIKRWDLDADAELDDFRPANANEGYRDLFVLRDGTVIFFLRYIAGAGASGGNMSNDTRYVWRYDADGTLLNTFSFTTPFDPAHASGWIIDHIAPATTDPLRFAIWFQQQSVVTGAQAGYNDYVFAQVVVETGALVAVIDQHVARDAELDVLIAEPDVDIPSQYWGAPNSCPLLMLGVREEEIEEPEPEPEPDDDICVMGVVGIQSFEARPAVSCIGLTSNPSVRAAAAVCPDTSRIAIDVIEAGDRDGDPPDPDEDPDLPPDPDPEPGRLVTVTTVTIVGSTFVYNGVAYTPAVVSVTGPGLSLTPAAVYLNNVHAGQATAYYEYPGDDVYLPSSGLAHFTIAKAPTVTTVTIIGGPSFVETGSPITPAVVSVTGPGGLSLAPTATYANNTNPGTATASYSYPGAANYLASSDSETFLILEDDGELPPPGPGVLTFADFTHLGTILLPDGAAGSETVFGQGLAAYRQPFDDNQIHLIVGAFRSGAGERWPLLEVRYHTPENPVDPTDASQYTPAVLVKNYEGAPYTGAGAVYKRLTKIGGVEVAASASSGPDFMGISFGPDGKLYIVYVFTYSDGSDPKTWSVMRAVLDYNTPSASYAEGPWGIDIHGNKAVGKSVMRIPASYRAFTGGRPLALGGPGYGSIAAQGDVSMGLSITAIPTPTAAEKTDLAGLAVMGYWPFAGAPGAGRDRSNRPEAITSFIDGSWPGTKWTWDSIEGGSVWIDDGVKRGVVMFTTQSLGAIDYLSSAPYAQKSAPYWGFYDPLQFKAAAGGNLYDAQPIAWEKQAYPAALRDSETVDAVGTITNATSTAGVGFNNNGLTGAHLVVPSHGLNAGDWVAVLNSPRAEYCGLWEVSNIVDANEFTIWSPNDSSLWSGIAAAGGTVTSVNTNRIRHQGADYLESDKLLFVRWQREGFSAGEHKSFVEVYQLNTPTPPPPPPPGLIFYASLSGDDANPGTLAAPKRTVRAAAALAGPGGLVYLRGGTYTTADDVFDSALYSIEKGTDWSAPITFAAYPGETVVIQPPDGVHAHRLSNADKYLVFQDIEWDYVNDTTSREGVYVDDGSHHIRFRRCTVRNCANLGVVFTNQAGGFCEWLGGRVTGCGTDDFDLTRGHAFYISCGDNLFEGVEVDLNAGYGFHCFDNAGPKLTSRNTIRYCNIHHNGLTHSTAYAIVFAWGDDNLAHDNLIYRNQDGVWAGYDAGNSQFIHNTIAFNVNRAASMERYTSAPVFQNNISFGNGINAITDDGNGTGTPIVTPNLIGTDPLFVNGAGDDYHLTAPSPANGTASTLAIAPTDFDGVTRAVAGACSYGALEYVA